MQDNRVVLVPPGRLSGWVRRFGERNGPFRSEQGAPGVLVLHAANGCTATITAPPALLHPGGPGRTDPGKGTDGHVRSCDLESAVDELIRLASRPLTVGLLLLRRGGYGVGLASRGVLVASKNGTRYVQSRTAAGGWSQQRFARRRANQADALVETAAEQAAAIFGSRVLDCLQPGGDSMLVGDCLDHSRLSKYRALPRLPLLQVPDPRRDVLSQAAADTQALRIRITGIPER